MSITGVREFGHTDEISFPNGDADDFVEFELPNNSNPAQRIQVELDCALEGELDAIVRATLFEDGIATTRSVRCNEGRVDLTVDNTRVQSLRIAFSVVSDPTFVDYTLRVIAFD